MTMEARRLAQDENTPAELLARLANNRDRLIRLYVAGNINTPVETLLKLDRQFPKEAITTSLLKLQKRSPVGCW